LIADDFNDEEPINTVLDQVAGVATQPTVISVSRKRRQSSLMISTHNFATNETEIREFKFSEVTHLAHPFGPSK